MELDPKLVEEIVRKIVSQESQTKAKQPLQEKPIPVGVSARHVHLSRHDLDLLFGEGYELTVCKDLMGDEFAAKEQVTVIGPSLRPLEKIRVLGPVRKESQVEISRTDSFVLKVVPPVRPSGKHEGTPGITVIGPKGVVCLERGCIIANRHIHMSPLDAQNYGVQDGDIVDVLAEGERKALLYDVQIRVGAKFRLEMHIDTDDANAVGFLGKPTVTLLKR